MYPCAWSWAGLASDRRPQDCRVLMRKLWMLYESAVQPLDLAPTHQNRIWPSIFIAWPGTASNHTASGMKVPSPSSARFPPLKAMNEIIPLHSGSPSTTAFLKWNSGNQTDSDMCFEFKKPCECQDTLMTLISATIPTRWWWTAWIALHFPLLTDWLLKTSVKVIDSKTRLGTSAQKSCTAWFGGRVQEHPGGLFHCLADWKLHLDSTDIKCLETLFPILVMYM